MQIDVHRLGLKDYEKVWHDMQKFTQLRDDSSKDEIWIVEHPSVFTLGLNGQRSHLLSTDKSIPVIKTDRGGQVTYHGSGQLVIYPLLDLNRLKIGVRQLVTILEQAMISTLAQFGIEAYAKPEAPGVYVGKKKIGSVGLRVKKGCSYHGLSLNNNLDLSPFDLINTCGYPGMEVTRLTDFDIHINTHELAIPIVHSIVQSINI